MATPAGDVETPGETIPGDLASPPPPTPMSPPVVRVLEPEFGGATETPVAETQLDSPDPGNCENHGLGHAVPAVAEKPAPTPSTRVRDLLKANKEKKETSASALHQAILALGPPGQLTKEQLATELLSLHEQMHGNESCGAHEAAGDKAVGKPLEETPEKILQTPLPKSMPPPAKVPNKALSIACPPDTQTRAAPQAKLAVVEAKPAAPLAVVQAKPAPPTTAPTAVAVPAAPLTACVVAEAKAASPPTALAANVGSTGTPGPGAVANPGPTTAPAAKVALAPSVAPAESTDQSVEQKLLELRPHGPMGMIMHGKGCFLD